MSEITLNLPPATEAALRSKAAQAGLTVEAYLHRLADDAAGTNDRADSPSAAEFDRLLDEIAAGPSSPPLPDDLSRADIYDSHD